MTEKEELEFLREFFDLYRWAIGSGTFELKKVRS